jgi:thymidylate kinase
VGEAGAVFSSQLSAFRSRGRNSEQRPTLIVEFAGSPGSGKTTTAREVSRVLQDRGFSCAVRPPLAQRREELIVHRAAFLWHRFVRARTMLRALRFSLSVRPRTLSRIRPANHLLFIDYYLSRICAGGYDVILMDQGFAQTLWSMMVRGNRVDLGAMNRLIGSLYSSYRGVLLFTMVEVKAEVAIGRAHARGRRWSRFDHMPTQEATSLITAHSPHLRLVIARAARVSRAPVQHLNGRRPPEENAAELADVIQQHLRRG